MGEKSSRATPRGGPEKLTFGGVTGEDSATCGAAQQRRGKHHAEALVHGEDGVRVVPVKGRVLWALRALMQAGPSGCTPIDTPGPRWSDYVFKLRRAGINVETIHESHGGPFSGHHARYVLRSVVELRQPVEAAGQA